MNNEIIMRKQEKNTILIYSHTPYIFSSLFILFPCKQIIEMIQKCHIKTSTLGYNEPIAFAAVVCCQYHCCKAPIWLSPTDCTNK